MDNDRGIPKTGIPFAVQMVREKIGALRVMPTREEIQKLLAIRMQTGAGLVEFTHSHNLHKIISTHLLTVLIMRAIVQIEQRKGNEKKGSPESVPNVL